jgi:hypothetical protein
LTDKNQFLGFENFAMVDTSQNLAMGSSQFEFAEPMVFDLIGRLGAIPGEREIKYLMIIPLNGEPIEFVPEYEQVTSIKLITFAIVITLFIIRLTMSNEYHPTWQPV